MPISSNLIPPGPPSPANMPTKRNTSSSGAPKRRAIRLDRMPARTSRLPSNIATLTVSSRAITRILRLYRTESRTQEQREIRRRWTQSPCESGELERHLVAALEREDFAGLVGIGDLQPKSLQDLAHLGDLLRIRFGEFPGADPERILHADADMATHGGGERRDAHLVGPGTEHRPVIVVAEQTIRRALHHHDILGMRSDAAKDAEHRLHEERRLHQSPVEEVPQGIEMADVITLNLEAGAIPGACRENVFDVREGILEHSRTGPFQIRLLPLVFELALVARDHRIEAKIHRAHVERGNFRLEGCSGTHPLFSGHCRRTAGRDVHDHIGTLLDHLEERSKSLGCLVRTAILRIARIKV